jgi:hypothetical protein
MMLSRLSGVPVKSGLSSAASAAIRPAGKIASDVDLWTVSQRI